MKLSYYPGCTGHGTGREMDDATRKLCAMLDIELQDLPDWNCCGASSGHTAGEKIAIGLAARNVEIAEKEGMDVLTPCPACFGRLANAALHTEKPVQTQIMHDLHLFSRPEILKKISEKVTDGLKGMKLVSYYGCLFTRPPEITGAKNPENPMEMDRLMTAIGAEAIDWPYKTQCCGGSLTMTRDELVLKFTGDIFDMAGRFGAQAIVTGCPMCFMNMERGWLDQTEQGNTPLPIFYFTELMLLALEPSLTADYFSRHLSDPSHLLGEYGLTQ